MAGPQTRDGRAEDGTAIGWPICSPRAPGSLMRGLILRDDLGRNTAALAYLVAALPGPRPDLGAPLAPGAGPGAAAAASAAALARVIDVLRKILAELACVIGTQVDLVSRAVEAERHCLDGLTPIEIVDEQHLNLLRHGSQPFC